MLFVIANTVGKNMGNVNVTLNHIQTSEGRLIHSRDMLQMHSTTGTGRSFSGCKK